MNKPEKNHININQAMILAAGLGTRMRPLTLGRPKALVPVIKYPLIDHIITKLSTLNINDIIVNLHHHADMLEAHLNKWENVDIEFSSERKYLLDSGGGVKRMLERLKKQFQPFLLLNCDSLWVDSYIGENLMGIIKAWDSAKMDVLLALTTHENSLGYDGRGDFFLENSNNIKRRGAHEKAPYIYTGMAIIDPSVFNNSPDGKFNLNIIFDKALREKRLYGHLLNGHWLHVGTPKARSDAEIFLKEYDYIKKSLYAYAPLPT